MSFKNKNILLLFMLFSIALVATIFTQANTYKKESDNGKIKIVTSFYPMYIATANIVSDIDNVELSNLTEPSSGCPHDYQLTPQDMITLESADIFVINGGGMESFIEDIVIKYPNITIINASENIELLTAKAQHNHENVAEHNESNAHIWVSITKYIQQVENIKNGMIKFDTENQKNYNRNTDEYVTKLDDLKIKMHTELNKIKNRDIIIFHDSFEYFAEEFGLNVKHIVVMESDTSLSAGDIAQIVDEIDTYNIKVLFAEAQYSDQIATSIAKETKASVYILDSGVNGELDKDAYIKAMEKNLEVMKEALNK